MVSVRGWRPLMGGRFCDAADYADDTYSASRRTTTSRKSAGKLPAGLGYSFLPVREIVTDGYMCETRIPAAECGRFCQGAATGTGLFAPAFGVDRLAQPGWKHAYRDYSRPFGRQGRRTQPRQTPAAGGGRSAHPEAAIWLGYDPGAAFGHPHRKIYADTGWRSIGLEPGWITTARK